MELHQLRYFVAVAQLENFTRAAQKCFVAQPSLSQQIIKLERECGGPLFDRSGRKVRLTDRGRTLFDRAIEILAAVEGAKRALTEDVDAGQLTVGAIPTIAPYLLPPLLKRFLRDYPKTEVTVSENLTEYTIQACLEGDIDVGVLALPISEDQLAIEPLLTEELLLAMAAGHPLAARRHVSMQDVSLERFVLLSETHCLGRQVVSFCKGQSCQPAISCRSAQLLTVQELVAAGNGVSLIPQMAVSADRSQQTKYRSLTGEKPTRTIAMIWRKNRYHGPAVERFIAALRDYAANGRSANGRRKRVRTGERRV
ncbi:MAG TPA: LysR family transcriptional regulator [Planctomycetaceae bacterium]|jgi:LysR family hydrogen peroxide-inducible transcriptional activator|nr:LysR family transcriptional regulator [Planctomycetaceae bacterium]